MAKKLISAKDLARSYEMTYHTVNYYTVIGLLPVEAKKGNCRFYDDIEVKRRMDVIDGLIREGYPLNLIKRKMMGEL